MKKIIVFDPSLKSNKGDVSINLGDVVIWTAVKQQLQQIFSHDKFLRISSHSQFESEIQSKLKEAKYTFFGGSNMLSSNLKEYNQWKLDVSNRLFWPIKFPIKGLVLMGVGWWQYQSKHTAYTRSFYKKALSNKFLHSVRDGYTERKLKEMGFGNVLNTGCPTMWGLDGLDVSCRRGRVKNCLFTLTDYNQDSMVDNELIKVIVESYEGNVYFFPQGSKDMLYIASLSHYQQYKHKIRVIDRSYAALLTTLIENEVDYIGTRLHAGVVALQQNRNTLILSIDNRAIEIATDTGLPVLCREDVSHIKQWISGESIFDKIRIPLGEVNAWKQQFKKD